MKSLLCPKSSHTYRIEEVCLGDSHALPGQSPHSQPSLLPLAAPALVWTPLVPTPSQAMIFAALGGLPVSFYTIKCAGPPKMSQRASESILPCAREATEERAFWKLIMWNQKRGLYSQQCWKYSHYVKMQSPFKRTFGEFLPNAQQGEPNISGKTSDPRGRTLIRGSVH